MASLFIFLIGLENALQVACGRLTIGLIAGVLRLVAIQSSFGVALAFWLYLIASMFEAKLGRRRAEWDYFCATQGLKKGTE
jgi:hypothetical protein